MMSAARESVISSYSFVVLLVARSVWLCARESHSRSLQMGHSPRGDGASGAIIKFQPANYQSRMCVCMCVL